MVILQVSTGLCSVVPLTAILELVQSFSGYIIVDTGTSIVFNDNGTCSFVNFSIFPQNFSYKFYKYYRFIFFTGCENAVFYFKTINSHFP